MRLLHVDPFGGLAGDMFLAALLDLEDPAFTLAELQDFVDATLPNEARLTLVDTLRRGIGAKHLDVAVTGAPPMRHPADLAAVIEASPLGERGRTLALEAIERIAVVEAEIHRIPRASVHFHELGAVDTVVDLAGAAFALERLGVERVEHAPPYVGGGTVHTEHGELPVPAPATAALLLGTVWRAGAGGERLTPTGAALLSVFSEPAVEREWTPLRVGYGAGTRDGELGPANCARVTLGEVAAGSGTPGAVDELAFQLDDATGEEIAFLLEGLMGAGALDAWTVALGMKKGRPGVGIGALVQAEDRSRIERVVFERSPTLGLRWHRCERTVVERDIVEVEVEGRRIRVKRRRLPFADEIEGSAWGYSPEFEDLASWARETGRSLAELSARVVEAARESAP